jgi:alpha-tubulin suppressor-like RCC1 family protein
MVGASCGPDALATCNEGYACLGPRTKLTAMHLHTCAVADDGKVWCWGSNGFGELGDGTTVDSSSPIPVRLPRPAIDVSAGYAHTCAVLDDGNLYCWGSNENVKAVPSSPAFIVSEPTRVETPGTQFEEVTCSADHTCGLTRQSTVWCWGRTREGQSGVDGVATNNDTVGPTPVSGLDEVHKIDSGLGHTCVVRRGTPSLLCWGSNRSHFGDVFDGKLGPTAQNLDYSATPVATNFDAPVLNMGIGYESTYAVVADGTTYAWGSDANEQLGTESTGGETDTPGPVKTYDDMQQLVPLRSVSEVARTDASGECAQMQDLTHGSRYLCWGTDASGELGFGIAGAQVRYPKPTTVLPQEAANLARAEQRSCFTIDKGGVVEIDCFGRQPNGIGDAADSVSDQLSPVPVQWDPARFERYLAR